MKRLLALALAAATALPLFAQTNVGVSVRINQPGVYGRVDFGNVPPPPVVFAEPILVAPPRVVVQQAPMYLYVPPGHQRHWAKHCRRYHPEHSGKTLQEIYEDPWFYASFICNYQTKIFSMSPNEALAEDRLLVNAPRLPPRRELGDGQNLSSELTQFRDQSPGRFSLECFAASTGVIHVDDRRLAIAKESLAAVDVVGVTARYDYFLNQLVDRYNWDIKPLPHRHVGESGSISPEFRRRIASDNAFDLELYEHAMALSN